MDKLSKILQHFEMQANVFFSGNLCELSEFEETKGNKGHLHVLSKGSLRLIDKAGVSITIDQPSLLFFPQGRFHRLVPDSVKGADLVCATIEYNSVMAHPIAKALPSMVSFELGKVSNTQLAQTAAWLFEEAFAENNGKAIMINKLCDIFVIQLLREVIGTASVQQGMLAGLAHPLLSKALSSIHEQADRPWTIESLAIEALMSRSKFAQLFHRVVGQTPLGYLTDWRMHLAQGLLTKNLSVELVANKVGYENGSTLARVFKKKLGNSPKQWLKNNQ
ncbi:MAG: AraC-like DNA-binding protein [Glaciecola sp.]|jgi:AraC-like DNA-binding protein